MSSCKLARSEITSDLHVHRDHRQPNADGLVKIFRIVARKVDQNRYVIEGRIGKLPLDPEISARANFDQPIFSLLRRLSFKETVEAVLDLSLAGLEVGWWTYGGRRPLGNVYAIREELGRIGEPVRDSEKTQSYKNLVVLIPKS